MTKKLFMLCMALVCTVALMAQNIAVVSPSGSTIMCKTLTQAVDTAAAGSVIYLPGGYFHDGKSIVIKKKLTIIGIGHNTKSDNPDGHTQIDDVIYFHEGSDGSALMGCKVTYSISIGNYGNTSIPPTNDILLRGNRLSGVNLKNTTSGTVIDQNIINNSIAYDSSGSGTQNHGAIITNNVVGCIYQLYDAEISNNIIYGKYSSYNSVYGCYRSSIINNIIMYGIQTNGYFDNSASGNMMTAEFGDDSPIIVGGDGFDWSSVFVKYDKSYPWNSDFHFSGDYKKYEGKVGIYAGTGFSDKPLAPVPYIVSKHVDQNTDASGKLSIKVRVKASGGE